MSTFVKLFNEQHKELRRLLSSADQHQQAIDLFLRLHATLHSRELDQGEAADEQMTSLADELFHGLQPIQIRSIPRSKDHSVAWSIWHIARIEDVTMNMLIAGRSQTLNRGGWQKKMKVDLPHTGNMMDRNEIAQLSTTINLEALRAYRLAVGRDTRQIVRQLEPEKLSQRVESRRLENVMAQGAVLEDARDLILYWGKKTHAGLLLMPATRHNLVHLNEALRLVGRHQ